jgi:hypothetical protein
MACSLAPANLAHGLALTGVCLIYQPEMIVAKVSVSSQYGRERRALWHNSRRLTELAHVFANLGYLVKYGRAPNQEVYLARFVVAPEEFDHSGCDRAGAICTV